MNKLARLPRVLLGRAARKLLERLGYDVVRQGTTPRDSGPSTPSRPPGLPPEYAAVRRGSVALWKLMTDYEFSSVLDIGSGGGAHAALFAAGGKEVVAVDFGSSCYFREHEAGIKLVYGNYVEIPLNRQFDVVWASHVLEHQPNVQLFLKKMIGDCREGGIIAITVPPLKHEIVGGHLSLWNAGLLLYNLVFSGCDCSQARVISYGYNVSVIVENRQIVDMPELSYDCGDIDRLAQFFPAGLREGFDGRIDSLNWGAIQPSDLESATEAG